MVIQTLAFVIVRRALGLVGLAQRRTPGRRDRGAAPSVDGGARAGRSAAVHPAGPAGAGHVGPDVVEGPLAGFPGRPLRRCCAGIVSWWAAAGRTRRLAAAGAAWIPTLSSWCCGWRGRTRAGDTYESWGSAASWVSGYRRPGCGGS